MEATKMVLMSLFAGQHWRRRRRAWTWGPGAGRRDWEKLRGKHGSMYIVTGKVDSK